MAHVPRRRPSLEKLKRARIVAHRGAHDLDLENTLSAFERALELGAWGIEFDIRFSRCGQPMIHHDASCLRLFNDQSEISRLGFDEIRSRFPKIPTLRELLEKVGGKCHLMIEIKGQAAQITKQHWQTLKDALKDLKPVDDYHLMALNREILLQRPIAPKEAWLPIAEFNVSELSNLALNEGLGGVTSQYAIMHRGRINKHQKARQKIGTGFVSSRSVLFREINHGVDWLFSDNAAQVIAILKNEIALLESGLARA